MNIDITARHLTLSDDLKDFIYEKVSKISKYDDKIHSLKVVLLKETRAEKVEIIATSDKDKYITNCYSSAFEKTILKAVENIITQIRKSKSKK